MENMTTQEIADYLEEQGYPMNSINDVSSDNCILYTGLKGGYLMQAALIQFVHSQLGFINPDNEPITKAYLDNIIYFRKNYPKKGLI